MDDHHDTALSLAMLFEIDGHEVHIAHDGLEAIEVAVRVQPDVVLLDIGLPRMDGYETCRRMRDQAWGKQLVIVAISGISPDEDPQRARVAGFDGHLAKPVHHEALVETLVKLSARRGGGVVRK